MPDNGKPNGGRALQIAFSATLAALLTIVTVMAKDIPTWEDVKDYLDPRFEAIGRNTVRIDNQQITLNEILQIVARLDERQSRFADRLAQMDERLARIEER